MINFYTRAYRWLAVLLLFIVLPACGEDPLTATARLSLPTRELQTVLANTATSALSRTGLIELAPTPAITIALAHKEAPLPVSATGGLQEISVDSAISTGMVKEFPGVSDPQTRFFGSDDKPDNLIARLDKYFTSDGYRFAFPGQDRPFRQTGALTGLYIKNGEQDVVLAVIAVSGDAVALETTLKAINIPNMDEFRARSLTARLRDRVSLLVVLTGDGLLQYMLLSGEANRIATPAASPQAQISAPAQPLTSGTEKGMGSDFFMLKINATDLPATINGVSPQEGFRFVALDITFTSQAVQGLSLKVATAQVLDQKLNQYPVVVAGKEPRLNVPPDLPRGQQSRGWLTFQIPRDSRPTALLCSVKTPAGEFITRLIL